MLGVRKEVPKFEKLKSSRDKFVAFQMYCYRRILRLSWVQKVTNVEVRRKLNISEDLMQVIMRRKLGLFGHIYRMDNSRKIKCIMLGTMDGTGRRGRPNREWLDDIRDWCQEDIHTLSVLAQDREMWKQKTKFAVDTYGALCPWIVMMMMNRQVLFPTGI